MAYIRIIILAVAVFATSALSAQVTSDVKDIQVAKQRLRIGNDTDEYFTSIVRVISAAATHRQSPTALAVYNYCQSILTNLTFSGTTSPVTLNSSTGSDVTFTAGTGIALSASGTNMTVTNTGDLSTTNEPLTISVGANSETLAGQTLTVTGTGIATPTYTPATNTLNIAAVEVDGSVTNEIQNLSTGTNTLSISSGNTVTVDTDPTNDLTTSTSFSGDVSGPWNNLQLGSNVVGPSELASTAVTAGTYSVPTLTIDSDGRVTSAANGTADPSITNEGALSVGAGTSTTSEIISNTSGSTPVTIQAGNGLNITETGNTIIMGINGGQDAWIYGGNSPGTIRSIGTNDANALDIETNGVRRIRILPDGKIGISTTIPAVTVDLGESTDGMALNGGTIGQRVTYPRTLRFNTSFNGAEIANQDGLYMPINGSGGITTTTGTATGGTGQLISVTRSDITGVNVSVRCGNAPTANGIILTLTWAGSTFNRAPTFTIMPGGQQSAGLQFWTSYATNAVNIHVGGTLVNGLTYPLLVNINP